MNLQNKMLQNNQIQCKYKECLNYNHNVHQIFKDNQINKDHQNKQ